MNHDSVLKNRIAFVQPDYIFAIVRKPTHWQPARIDDIPPKAVVLTKDYVASYEEACDDLIRHNQLSLDRGHDTWAVVQSPGGEL